MLLRLAVVSKLLAHIDAGGKSGDFKFSLLGAASAVRKSPGTKCLSQQSPTASGAQAFAPLVAKTQVTAVAHKKRIPRICPGMECFFCHTKQPPLIQSSRISSFREASSQREDGLGE
ncbi:hypothetical protein ACOMHN_055418 [Nucella lapillus]